MTKHESVRRHGESRQREMRQRIATEAARLITEQGIGDYGHAARKAAERVGVSDPANLPRHDEIEDALREYQRLFRHAEQPAALRVRREAALEAMRFFAAWDPRLVGPVLDGTADAHSPVTLHLFADEPTLVAQFLAERRIPYEGDVRKLRVERDRSQEFPRLRFDADEIAIELVIFPPEGQRVAPLGSDDKPVPRAAYAAVAMLLRGVG
jgi:hypothetical protein